MSVGVLDGRENQDFRGGLRRQTVCLHGRYRLFFRGRWSDKPVSFKMIHRDTEHKIALDKRLRTLEASPTERCAGRGIVICAGGSALFTNAYVLVHVLQNAVHCRLPIEVWYFGSAEMSPRMVSLLRLLGAEPVDATVKLATRPAAVSDGWPRPDLCSLA
jgi:hypothetical protein